MFKFMKEKMNQKYACTMFDVLSRSTSDVYILFSPDDFTVSYVSPNVENVLGLTVDEVLYDIHVLWRTSEEEASYPTVEEIRRIRGEKTYSRELARIHMITRENKHFKETAQAVTIFGKEYILAILSDRTKENRERQILAHELYVGKSQWRVRKEFVYNMSKAMLTPMNTMKGLISLLERDKENVEKVEQRIQQLDATYNHFSNTVEHLIGMNHVVRNTEELSMIEFEPKNMLTEIIQSLDDKLKAKNLSVVCEIAPVHKKYLGAERSIRIALYKLFANILESTRDDSLIKVKAEILKVDMQEGYVKGQFSIDYTCENVDDEMLLELERSIFREDTTTLAKDLDSYAEIAVCKYLIEVMGGAIAFKKHGENRVTLEVSGDFLISDETMNEAYKLEFLPGTKEDDEMDLAAMYEYSLQGIKILMAEDNALNAEILQELLTLEGAICDVASNGKEALSQFLATTRMDAYDVIIMDIQMPVMNGYEAAKAIRESAHPDGKRIPIIALTANVLESDINHSLEAGMNAHLSKPVDMKQIKEVIHTHIKK